MSKLVDWQLTIPGVELKSSNHDLRGVTRQGMFGKSARAKKQREAALLVCRSKFGKAPPPPLVITITRIAPAELDTDNNVSSAKHIRDGISDWLGVNDRDKRLRWEYAQEKQGKGVYGVRIRVQTWRQSFDEVLDCSKVYQQAHKKCLLAAEKRMDATDRASVKRSNAAWDRANAARDRIQARLRQEWEAQNVLCV